MSRVFRALCAVALLIGIALAIAVAVAVTERIAFAEWLLHERIAALDVAPAALQVTGVDARGITIERFAIGAEGARDLEVEQIDATWSLEGVRAGRLDTLAIRGVELRGAMRDGALSLGALDPLLTREGDASKPPVLPASAIEIETGRIRIETPQGVAKGALGGSLTSDADGALDGNFSLTLDGAGLRASGNVALSGSLDEPSFRASLKPVAGLPIAGRIDVRGRVVRAKGERALDATVALRDASYTSAVVRASGINGTVALRAPPLRTPPKQILALTRVDVGVPLTDGIVDFELRSDGRVAVALVSMHFASGELRAENVVLDLNAEQTPVTLRARSLDLTELLARVDLPGIDGTGLVEGEVPLVLAKSSIRVQNGLLRASEGGGKIMYTPDEKTRALAASRPNDLGLAIEAFSDFQYEVLEARLDGELQGEMKIGLHVRGVNPAFQDGRPVELNLNLEARLADLVRAGAASYRVPTVVEERLKAFAEGEGR